MFERNHFLDLHGSMGLIYGPLLRKWLVRIFTLWMQLNRKLKRVHMLAEQVYRRKRYIIAKRYSYSGKNYVMAKKCPRSSRIPFEDIAFAVAMKSSGMSSLSGSHTFPTLRLASRPEYVKTLRSRVEGYIHPILI